MMWYLLVFFIGFLLGVGMTLAWVNPWSGL